MQESVSYGRFRTGSFFDGILASIPDGRFEPHHIIVKQETEKAVRVALRWSYCGSHHGRGRYGAPSGVPLALLGISHFELRQGRIVNEWMLLDETAIYAQIAAHQLA
jgi:predicted ester cyclase